MSRIDALPKPMSNQRAEGESPKYSNIVGWILAVSVTCMAILLGGRIEYFINLPSILLVLGVSCFLGTATYGWRDFSYSVKALVFVYRKRVPSSLEVRHVNIIRSMRRYLLLSGCLGFLVGIVQMLQNLDDPTAIGPALAVALLTVFCSLVLVLFLCQPAVFFLENYLQDSRMKDGPSSDI